MTGLKGFTPRLYQETILNTCVKHNTLVVLPTGMGKTAIALMLASHRLSSYPNSKILFLAPTKPLVAQHMTSFRKSMDVSMAVLTGEISPELWEAVSLGAEAEEEDMEAFEEKMKRLTSELSKQMADGRKLDEEIRENLLSIGFKV